VVVTGRKTGLPRSGLVHVIHTYKNPPANTGGFFIRTVSARVYVFNFLFFSPQTRKAENSEAEKQ